MKTLAVFLRAGLAPWFLLVSFLHLLMGFGAEMMLGADVGPETWREPTLDSQNRFYGVAFSLFGVVLYICGSDLRRYEPVFKATLGVFFAAGLARLASWYTYGAPSNLVVVLIAIELVGPPLLLLWWSRVRHEA